MAEISRAEHIAWCKKRAIQEIEYTKDPKQGVISIMSDIRKHSQTDSEILQALCLMTIMDGSLTKAKAIEFINGFN